MTIDGYEVIGPLAYQGKEGCESPTCTRRRLGPTDDAGTCIGWHCSYCDAPCSSQGHRCDAANAILGEAQRIADEARP